MLDIENSKFFRLIDKAITYNLLALVKELYYCLSGGLINQDLELIYFDSPPEMERAVRSITASDILFNCLGGKFVMRAVPEDKKEDIEWFIKVFVYLEAETGLWELNDTDIVYPPSQDVLNTFNNKNVNFIVDVSELHFLYNTIEVTIQSN